MKKLLPIIAVTTGLLLTPLAAHAAPLSYDRFVVTTVDSPEAIDTLIAETTIMDNAGLFTPEDIERINEASRKVKTDNNLYFAVETLNSLNGQNIATYTTNRANELGVGTSEANNGLLYVIDMETRKYYVAKGSGIDAKISDAQLDDLLTNRLQPALASGAYADGIVASAHAIGNAYSPSSTSIFTPESVKAAADAAQKEYLDGVMMNLLYGIGGVIVLIIAICIAVSMNNKRKKKTHEKMIAFIAENAPKVSDSWKENFEKADEAGRLELLDQMAVFKNSGYSMAQLHTAYLESVYAMKLTRKETVAGELKRREDREKATATWNTLTPAQQSEFKALQTSKEREAYLNRNSDDGGLMLPLLMLYVFSAYSVGDNTSVAAAESSYESARANSYTSDSSSSYGGGSFDGGGAGGDF